MFGAFSLQKDCRMEMGRLNTVADNWSTCCHLHGSHTAPGVGEGTEKTTSLDHLNDSTHGRRWNSLLPWRCRGTRTETEEGVGLKLLFSPACVHSRKLCEGKSWCRTGCYLLTEGKRARALTPGITLVSQGGMFAF